MTETTAENLVDRFDAGEDVLDYFDVDHPIIEAPADLTPKDVKVSLPAWLVESLDREATRRGIARRAVINTALVEWTDEQADRRARREAVAL